MYIYEKIFARLEELHMSQIELSRRTGIATSTISDWRKKKINPQADKLVDICKALDMALVDLLCDEEDKKSKIMTSDYISDEELLIERIINSSDEFKRRVISYIEASILCVKYMESGDDSDTKRNVSIIHDAEGNKIVLINDIIFKGKRSVEWADVEKYLRQYVGEFYQIADTKDIIYIGGIYEE